MASDMHQAFGEKLEILLFPSDEFGRQELPEAQAADFCVKKGLPTNAPGSKPFRAFFVQMVPNVLRSSPSPNGRFRAPGRVPKSIFK